MTTYDAARAAEADATPHPDGRTMLGFIVTADQLRHLGACREQRDLFMRLFGASAEVTEALCVKHAAEFSWNWAAKHLLSSAARRAFNEAVESAERACTEAELLAWRAYDAAKCRAYAQEIGVPRQDAEGPAFDAKERAFDAAVAAGRVFDAALAAAWRAYAEAQARAFARAALA